MYAKNLIFPGAGIQLLCSTVSVILDKLKYFDKSYVFIIFISDQSLSKLITNHSYTLQVYSTVRQWVVLMLILNKYTGAGRKIIEGANIHIFVFTDCKNNRFQKKLHVIKQNAHI